MIKFVRLEEDISLEELQQRLKLGEIKVIKKYKLTNIFKIEIPDVKEMSVQSLNAAIQPFHCKEIYHDFEVHHCLDIAIPLVGVNLVWQRPNRGEDMIIGICDTGVDQDHPDIAGRILGTIDFTGEGNFDGNGHGTHVTTIAIGNGSKSNGLYSGAATEAKTYMAKGLRSDGSGSASSIADGIEWLYEQNVHVISLSLGGTAQPGVKDILQIMCEAAVDQGIAVFCAAGNSGPDERTIGTPAVSTKVITIGASDDNDQVANFSSRGPTVDGYEKPDVVAPGVGIIAGRAKNTSLGQIIDDFYVELSGTSMATPLAAGVGLLIIKEYQVITPLNLKARLEGYAKDLGTGNDNIEGEGRIQALDSIVGTQPKPEPEVPIAEPQPGCFLTKLIGGGSSFLPVFRFIRDEFLAPTSLGRKLIKFYYSW
ncbi:MAG: S8 family serine peptidase [bacterium]